MYRTMKKTISIGHTLCIDNCVRKKYCRFDAIYIGNYDLLYTNLTNLSAYLSEPDLAAQSF